MCNDIKNFCINLFKVKHEVLYGTIDNGHYLMSIGLRRFTKSRAKSPSIFVLLTGVIFALFFLSKKKKMLGSVFDTALYTVLGTKRFYQPKKGRNSSTSLNFNNQRF